jgi:NAD-dependent DNA ligase
VRPPTPRDRVAAWLNIDISQWDAMVRAARARIKASIDAFRKDLVAKTVAFSGAGIHQPNIREALAAKHGFRYSTTVDDETDVLVIGTAQTDTAQARTARELSVPIIIETTFWRRLGEV